MHMLVLEYIEGEEKAIVEVWGSNHPLAEKIVNTRDLERISKHPSVTATLTSHPQSPAIIGRFGIMRKKAESVNTKTKRAKINGKTVSFARIEKNRQKEDIILDEG